MWKAAAVLALGFPLVTGCGTEAPTDPTAVLAARTSGLSSPPGHFVFTAPFDESFSCGTFDVRLAGTEHERNIGWFDSNGDLLVVEGLYQVRATYTSLATGESLNLSTNLHFKVDFREDGILETDTGIAFKLKGGTPVRDLGRFIFLQETGEILFASGQHDVGLGSVRPQVCAQLS
jgi:hypothetical protein